MNFVATLTTDTNTIMNPAWPDVEREIVALDARTQTLVILSPPPPKGAPQGEHHLAIGGGGDGRYIVYMTEDNLTFWNLTDARNRGAAHKIRMNIGGQEGEYEEKQFVSQDLALAAARRYAEDGGRSEALSWTKD